MKKSNDYERKKNKMCNKKIKSSKNFDAKFKDFMLSIKEGGIFLFCVEQRIPWLSMISAAVRLVRSAFHRLIGSEHFMFGPLELLFDCIPARSEGFQCIIVVG